MTKSLYKVQLYKTIKTMQVPKGNSQIITSRQRQILDLAYDWIHISYPSICRFLGITLPNARYIISQLRRKNRELITTGRIRGRYHSYLKHEVYWGYLQLTPTGLRQYGVSNPGDSESQEKHNLAAASLASWITCLAERHGCRVDTVKGSRSARGRYRTETESGTIRYTLKPDGAIELFRGNKFYLRIFLETDTGHEDIKEIAEKIRRYDDVLQEKEKPYSLILFSVFKQSRCQTFLDMAKTLEISSSLRIATQYAKDIIDPTVLEDVKVYTSEGCSSIYEL